ncbi:MAG: hypothetical protein ABUL67_03630 [Haliangium ochraceum]
MVGRFFLGIIKGGVIGGGLGYLATRAGLTSGALVVAVCGAVGALVGLLAGRPFWRHETMWTPILKGIFGLGLGIGLAFAGRKWLGGVHVPLAFVPGAVDHPLPEVPALLGGAIGIVYGILVEIDDAVGAEPAKPKTAA